MGDTYIFDLHVLVVASHIPPALSQSAFVLAVVTSAANADVVHEMRPPPLGYWCDNHGKERRVGRCYHSIARPREAKQMPPCHEVEPKII
jgi:hypothetical protein